MRKINALQLRQSLSQILKMLQKTSEPILLEKGRRPVAVIITLEDFKTRFIDKAADDQRKRILEEIQSLQRKSKDPRTAEEILSNLRAG